MASVPPASGLFSPRFSFSYHLSRLKTQVFYSIETELEIQRFNISKSAKIENGLVNLQNEMNRIVGAMEF